MNDNEPALLDLAAALQEISPDEVHITTPFRAAAEHWVHAPAGKAIARAREVIGEKVRLMRPAAADVKLGGRDDAEELVDLITRHPLPEEELRATLAGSPGDPDESMRHLAEDGRLQRVQRDGQWFWCPAGATYADGQVEGGATVQNPRKTFSEHARRASRDGQAP